MKQRIKQLVPPRVWLGIKSVKRGYLRGLRFCFEKLGLNVARRRDYYSPLPTESQLKKNVERWNRPSALAGVPFDLEKNKATFSGLLSAYLGEFEALPPHKENLSRGFGPGYPEVDALTLFLMIREHKPKRYIEVGSGLSTYYCSLAAEKNGKEESPLEITCIEPYPYSSLHSIEGIRLIEDEVQNVDLSVFQQLEAGDVLFIDSSHVVKLDGDVPFLFLEVLPALKPGVIVHVHDIPFPFNVPYPADLWVLGKKDYSPYWPMCWTEAMLLQAFLSCNSRYEIILSTPMIRHHDEAFLKENLPVYKPIGEEPNAFSSIWLSVRDAQG